MDENLWNLLIKLICLSFILLLFLMSCCVRNRDFTRSYVLFSLIPMTIHSVARFIYYIDFQFPFLGSYFSTQEALYYITHFTSVTADFSLATGTSVFLIMSIVAACGRQEFGVAATWLPYFLTTALSFVLGFVETYFHHELVYRVLYWLLLALFAFCIVLIVLIPFVSCCCTSSNPGKSSSPAVYNAKSRLGWVFFFAIFALFPAVSTTFYYELQHLFNLHNTEFGYYFLDFIILVEPIIFVLSAILFLPAYRTVFCCSRDDVQNFRNPAVVQSPIQPSNNFAPEPVPPQQAMGNQRAQTSQQQIDENLASYLTNPNQLQNLSNQLAVPSVTQCPNCKYPQIQSHPNTSHPQMMQMQQPLLHQPTAPPMALFAPEMMAQQTMPMQTTVQTTISHHQPMVQQQPNLVRFASQPNLVQFNTMQPAYSMPQLASVQSPFVVQQ